VSSAFGSLAIVIACMQAGTLLDRTLAIVAGRVVTLSDARTAVALGLVEGATVDRAVLERLIDRELMLREADRYQPPEPPVADVEVRLAAIAKRAGSAAALAQMLEAGGFTEARLRAWVRDDLRLEAYLQQRFAADERRQDLITDWIADLRRRADIIVIE
jgi:hypothetical protein